MRNAGYVWRFLGFVLAAAFLLVLLFKGFLPAWDHAGGDFANYYTASRLVVDGIALEPAYRDFSWFQQQMDRYGIRRQLGGWIPQPPPTALVLLPLAAFDPLTAKRIWLLTNLALLAGCVWLLSATTRLPAVTAALLLFATGYGLLNNFLFGQMYLLLLFSILLSFYLFQTGRPVLAGISLGLLIPVKYAGLPLLLYFGWKRHWRLCLACTTTAFLVVLAALLLTGFATFQTFLLEVLPRHLQGEILDPYSVTFQTWNSLYHRLFLYENLLSPGPLTHSPLLFLLFKQSTFWLLLSGGLLVLVRVQMAEPKDNFLFQSGWIMLLVILLSPAAATYHFLLLSISAVFFVRLLLKQVKRHQAILLASLFAILNLPHYMKVKALAFGWLTPLAYPRLGLLLLFLLVVVFQFRQSIRLDRKSWSRALLLALAGASAGTISGYLAWNLDLRDGAAPVEIENPTFRRHGDLFLHSPDRGSRQVVFSYSLPMDNEYSIFSLDGEAWQPRSSGNQYQPDLHDDDVSLLVERVVDGNSEIWRSGGPDQAWTFRVEGKTPAWRPGGQDFVFEKSGRLFHYEAATGLQRPVGETSNCFDPVFSPTGDRLFYGVRGADGDRLRQIDWTSGEEETLVAVAGRIRSPAVSSDGRVLAFSGFFERNWDIWALDLESRTLRRLTSHPAIDRDPVWDEANARLLFLSDRGRGLGCTTLFWIPLP